MSYRAGVHGLDHLGIPSDDAKITCDGCGLVWYVPHMRPPNWFLDGKAKPGWYRLTKVNERLDYCPTCITAAFKSMAAAEAKKGPKR